MRLEDNLGFDDIKDLRRHIVKFNNDEDVRSLENYYHNRSFAEIARISRKEFYHNNFIGWLLDVNESHGLSSLPVEKFIELLVSIDKESDLTKESELYDSLIVGDFELKKVNVFTEKHIHGVGRIDIYIEAQLSYQQKNRNLKIVIENKVGSKEHSDQTTKYYDAIELLRDDDSVILYVYLTPMSSIDLFDLTTPECSSKNYLQINYQLLVDHVIVPILQIDISTRTRSTLNEYLLSLSQPTLDQDDEEYKQGLIMALGKDEQLLLTRFWDKNQKLILAALYAIGSDPSQDKETRENATTALSNLSTSSKDRSKYLIKLDDYHSDVIKKSDIGLYTFKALEENNLIDEKSFKFLKKDKSCNFFLVKSKDEVTENEAKGLLKNKLSI
jgi:hypothetical protein